MVRNRVEDIGRILVLLDGVLDSSLFDKYSSECDWVNYYLSDVNGANEVCIERLCRLRDVIESVHSTLKDIYDISEGSDRLSEDTV